MSKRIGTPDHEHSKDGDGGALISPDTLDTNHGSLGDALIGPFSPGTDVTPVTGGTRHAGLTTGVYVLSGGKWTVLYREGTEHGTDTGSVIKAADTYDRGATLENIRTIIDTAVDVKDFRVHEMGSGRLGILATRVDGTGILSPLWAYSDDGGSTWSTSVLSTQPTMGIYEFIPFPASVGGHDTQGFIAYGQEFPTGGNRVVSLRTTDNGTSWTSETAIPATTGEDPTEPTVARLGADDKWLMLIRQNEAPEGSNATEATSTDLRNWSDLTDTQVELGGNPHECRYYNGHFYWMAFSRYNDRTSDREIENFGESIVHQSAPATDVFDDPTAWPGWSVLTGGQKYNLGYPYMFQDDGAWYATVAIGELNGINGTSRDSARVAVLSSAPSKGGTLKTQLIESDVVNVASGGLSKVVEDYELAAPNNYVLGMVRGSDGTSTKLHSSHGASNGDIGYVVETDTGVVGSAVDLFVENTTAAAEDIHYLFVEVFA